MPYGRSNKKIAESHMKKSSGFKMKGFSGFKQTQDEGKTFSQGGWSKSYEKKYQDAIARGVQKQVNDLVEKRKNLAKGSDEWNKNQNKINSLLKDPTRHKRNPKNK